MKVNLNRNLWILALSVLFGLGSCAKQTIIKNAISGLQGSWIIDSEKSQIFDYDARNTLVACGENLFYSGKFTLNENKTGVFTISATHCDTTYTVVNFEFEDFDVTYPGGEGRDDPRFHKYYASFIQNGDVVQFECWAQPGTSEITESTKNLNIHVSEKHDGSKNLNQLEIYDISLVLDKS